LALFEYIYIYHYYLLIFSSIYLFYFFFFFFFNDPPTTEIYTLFPTRRSSDLNQLLKLSGVHEGAVVVTDGADQNKHLVAFCSGEDRKSTRLNSSHDQISYAVFCLKKKKNAASFEKGPERAASEMTVMKECKPS